MATDDTTVDTEKLIRVYIKMRDHRAKLKADYEKADGDIRAQMDVIEQALLDTCKKIGADSLKTASGVAMRSTRTRYWTSDWDSMYKFIMENNMPQMLERRLSQTSMEEYLASNPDNMPPGVNADSKYVVTVRRAKN